MCCEYQLHMSVQSPHTPLILDILHRAVAMPPDLPFSFACGWPGMQRSDVTLAGVGGRDLLKLLRIKWNSVTAPLKKIMLTHFTHVAR